MPHYMLQDPVAVHTWWARARGGDLAIHLLAISVNAAEAGAVRLDAFDGGAFIASRSIAHPAGAGAEAAAPPLVIPGAPPGSVYRLEVRLTPPPPGMPMARHYQLKADGADALGMYSPMAAQAEAVNARWGFAVAPGETFLNVRVRAGPEAGATSGLVQLRDPGGLIVASSSMGTAISRSFPAPGFWTLSVSGADGHYVVEKLFGADLGLYAYAGTDGYGSISGAILAGGAPYPNPVSVLLFDANFAIIQSISATGAYAFPKIPTGQYTVVANGPGYEVPPRSVSVTCDQAARADFDLPNAPPRADAGPDQDVPEGITVQLDGSRSGDAEGPITYLWSIVSALGPPITLSDPTAPRPLFFAPDDAMYEFRLIVTDGRGSTASDLVRVRVRNVAPTVDAGGDQVQYWGLPVTLAGSGGDAGPIDRASLSFAWDFGDGDGAVGPVASHAYAVAGMYDARLTVADKDGASAVDAARVDIQRRPTSVLYLGPSIAPAGQSVTLTAQLDDLVDDATARLGGRVIAFELGAMVLYGVTDAAGIASVIAPPLIPGTYSLSLRFEGDADYRLSLALGTLMVPAASGHVTGGQLQMGPFARGGFNVRSVDGRVTGELQYQDRDVRIHAHELSDLYVSPDRRVAEFRGVSTTGVAFHVHVEDNGEPGRDDVFRISIAGAGIGGRLTGGNIQIHR